MVYTVRQAPSGKRERSKWPAVALRMKTLEPTAIRRARKCRRDGSVPGNRTQDKIVLVRERFAFLCSDPRRMAPTRPHRPWPRAGHAITENCRALASDLESDVDQYKLIASQPGPNFGLRAQQLQEIYVSAHAVRARWVRMCVPDAGTARCLPADLNQRTLADIERAAAAIGRRAACARSDR